jgi:hypothetical protein
VNRLSYKPNLQESLERLRLLYQRQAEDRIFASMSVPSPTLGRFAQKYSHGSCEYPDMAERVKFWDDLFQERANIRDDSMPAAYLSECDQGLYGGILGGEVRFMADPATGWISSMVPPLLSDWSEFDRLRFDPQNIWWQRYLEQLRQFVEGSRGKWGISHFILIDALNFVFELLGATKTYLSLDEHPDMVRRATDLAFDVNVRVCETFFQQVGLFEGGTFSNFAQWMPGRIVSESVDPFHMTSVAYFERWGREPAERIMNHFDGGVIHIHANGRHLLQATSTMRGLKCILLLNDRGFPTAFDVIEQLKARVGDVPVSLFAPYEGFQQRLDRHTLPGGALYQVLGVPDADAANRLMDKVWAYRVS